MTRHLPNLSALEPVVPMGVPLAVVVESGWSWLEVSLPSIALMRHLLIPPSHYSRKSPYVSLDCAPPSSFSATNP